MYRAQRSFLKSRLLQSAAIIVAATSVSAVAAQAQTANVTPSSVNVLNLLSPFLTLNSTTVGQTTLQDTLQDTISINNNATPAQAAMAISDESILDQPSFALVIGGKTYGTAANLAGGLPAQKPVNGITPIQPVGGLGSLLGPIYQTGVANGTAGPLANTVNLLVGAYDGFTSQNLGAAKNYFANGTTNGTTVAVAPTGFTLPTFNGLPNTTNSVYDLAFGVTNKQSGQNIFGDSRPAQVASSQIVGYDLSALAPSALGSNPSFPSGHTTYAYTDSILLAMLVPQEYQGMLLRASEFANSRAVLGLHYTLDLIGSRALASYDLAQGLTNPAYINNAATTGTAVNLPAMFTAAMPELDNYLQSQCGGTLTSCATGAANTTNDPYVNSAANQALYDSRLTYGLPTLTFAQAPQEAAPTGSPDASILLATIYGGSTSAAQTIAPKGGLDGNLSTATIDQIIMNTETNALAAFYGTSLSYWTRLDLYTASNYFQNVTGVLTMAPTDMLTTSATIGNTGVLVANGTITGPVNVNQGGTLGGIGTLGATTVNSGGTLAPGVFNATGVPTNIGTLHVNGNLAFNSGGAYLVQVTPTGDSTSAVTGTTSIIGTAVSANFTGASAHSLVGTTEAILTSTGAISGTFTGATLTGTLANSVVPTIVTKANEIDLSFTANTISSQLPSATSANQRSTAGAIDSILTSVNAPSQFVSLFGVPSSSLPNALDQLSGVAYADTQSAIVQDADTVRGTVLDRLRQIPYAGGGTGSALGAGGPVLMYADPEPQPEAFKALVTKGPAPIPSPNVAVWAEGFGSWGHFDGNGNAPAATRNLGGVTSGIDFGIGDAGRIGFAGGYTSSSLSSPTVGSSANVDSGTIALYGGTSLGAFNLRGGGAYTFSSVSTSRTITVPFVDQLKANYNADTGQIFGEIGYGMTLGQIAMEPFAGLAWVNLHTDAFTETGGVAALSGSATSRDIGYSTLGVRFASNILMDGGMVLTPRASFAWQHAFNDVTPTQALMFNTGGPNFITSGVPIAKDAALAEAGADLRLSRQASIGLSYVGQLGGKVSDNGVKGNFTWRW